jgi:hypothetical protein
MPRWRWGFPVPFPTSFANSPKRTCDHHRSRGKTRLWGPCGVALGPFHTSPTHPATVVRVDVDASAAGGGAGTADVFTEISLATDKQLWLGEAHLCGSRGLSDACPQNAPRCPLPGRHLITLNNSGHLRDEDRAAGTHPKAAIRRFSEFWRFSGPIAAKKIGQPNKKQ